MLNFLKSSRNFLSASEPICIIIGNESCDLDSAVCALALAFYYQQLSSSRSLLEKKHFLPVLNIPRRDYILKTEVTYFLRKHQITENYLTFRDELDKYHDRHQASLNNFILVDHHVSPFVRQCIQIYDHRPFDGAALIGLPTNCSVVVEQVGSCSTLIAETIIAGVDDDHAVDTFSVALTFLHAAIIMDTVNFSSEAARATTKDKLMAERIENILGVGDPITRRSEIFQELCAAREDISGLTAHQLLCKDMKLLTSNEETLKVALPGFPIRLEEFMHKPNVGKAIEDFAKEIKCNVIVLIGMKVQQDGNVQRDIGLINVNNRKLYEEILKELLSSKEPKLCLKELSLNSCEIMNCKCFQQENIKATRKHILPIIKRLLDQWRDTEN